MTKINYKTSYVWHSFSRADSGGACGLQRVLWKGAESPCTREGPIQNDTEHWESSRVYWSRGEWLVLCILAVWLSVCLSSCMFSVCLFVCCCCFFVVFLSNKSLPSPCRVCFVSPARTSYESFVAVERLSSPSSRRLFMTPSLIGRRARTLRSHWPSGAQRNRLAVSLVRRWRERWGLGCWLLVWLSQYLIGRGTGVCL